MQKFGVLAAAALVVAGVHGASAADIYDHGGGSLKDAPVDVPLPIWTGFYVGAGVGAAMGFHDANLDPVGVTVDETIVDAFGARDDAGSSSVLGTIQAGYDRQMGSRFVVGAFVDYDWTNLDTDLSGSTISLSLPLLGASAFSRNAQAKIDSTWTVGGRLGFLATPSTLVYGLLGWTHANGDLSTDFSVLDIAGTSLVNFRDSKDLESDGVTIGAGIETKLRDDWSLKLEYRFTDLDSENVGLALPILEGLGEAQIVNTHIDTEIHTVRAVLTYRPNWGY